MPEQETLDHSHCRRPSSQPTRSLLFYKLIVSSVLQAKRLRIPQKFVKKSGDQLSAVTTLTLPNGGVWYVGLTKADNKFWFYHGWHEFVEYYSIHVGYFLIFRYEGNSNFNANIFDLTASEINYPSNNLRNSEKTSHGKQCPASDGEEMNDDDDSVEILGSASPVSLSSKVFDECIDQQPLGKNYNENLHLAKDANNLQVTIRSSRDIGIQFNSSELTNSECKVGLLRLDEANGKTYRTKAKRKRNEPDANESPAKHKDEVEMPDLKTSAETSKQRWRVVTMEEKKRALHAAEMFQPSNPFCRVILRRSYVHERFLLHMPSRFAEKYLNGVSKFIKLQTSDGKQWHVRCLSGESRVKLSKGWTEFVKDNNLEEGDVCVFELINMENVVLKVSIFRVLDDARVETQSSN
ncbi:B3 domain-containing transcription factor VRN1 [Vitis vinifera]|uniref:B3 domain-containing transcription factor VRN1 n=1 Tax=Vitis vinifera TaxID=29760 RepID=A0A438FEH5_VITVI|nr:B3 domain-containing transcription factor VRN1 [Vitis vinifera]